MNETTTIICMLRGINVSGQKKVPMTELKKLFESLGFKNVTTYIQSGNVIFTSKMPDHKMISGTIEKKIREQFGFDVPVIVRSQPEMQIAVDNNPLIKEKDIDSEKLHITFLESSPDKDKLDKIHTFHFEPDRFIIAGRNVYLYCPDGYGRTKLNNTFFENKLKVRATTRNWRTVKELLRIASGMNL
jgi:uncharacterized protein (DUF1697 family)